MIRAIILLVISFYGLVGMGHDHSPHDSDPSASPQLGLDLRYILKDGLLTYIGEVQAHQNNFGREIYSAQILAYYRLHTNLKVGVLVRQQYGAVHDDDWLEDSGDWFWGETQNRRETQFGLDVTPRILLSDCLVGEIKLRYMYNDFNHHQTLKVRPGVTYFWLKQGKPFWNLFGRWERYVPLNFGNHSVYEDWLYLGGLFHKTPSFKPGFFVALKRGYWTPSQQAKVIRPGESYEYTENTVVLGLSFTFLNSL